MGGFGGWLGPALTATTNTVGAYQGAQADEADKRQRDLALQIQQNRQIHDDEIKNALITAQTKQITDPQAKPKRSTATFKVNGVPTLGSMSEDGLYYDAAGQPVTQGVTPFDKAEVKRIPRTFTVNGKSVEGLTDEQGHFYDAQGNPISGTITPYVAPKEPAPPQLVSGGVGPDGKPAYGVFNKGAKTIEAVDSSALTPKGAGGGSASLSPEDRAKMLAQAKLDNETMKAFEKKVLAGEASVGLASGVAGSLGSAHGTGVLPGIEAALGNTVTGAINPEYQNYLTAQRSYGRIMGNLQSKRYSDNQAEIERSISGLAANDLPKTIQYKQQLRDTSLADPSISTAPTTPTAATGAPIRDPGGNVDFGKPARPPFAERAHALKAQGLSKDAVKAQMTQEGYNLATGT